MKQLYNVTYRKSGNETVYAPELFYAAALHTSIKAALLYRDFRFYVRPVKGYKDTVTPLHTS